jgi:hypothetical protein
VFEVSAYEIEDNMDRAGDSFILIESVIFDSEDDAMDWADDMGYLNHHRYTVRIENLDTGRIVNT